MKKYQLAALAAALTPALANAQDYGAAAAQSPAAAAYWAAGICIGLAAAVGAFAQSRAAAAALEGIGRNPASAKNLFTPLILCLALMESLVLFALIIAFQLVGK